MTEEHPDPSQSIEARLRRLQERGRASAPARPDLAPTAAARRERQHPAALARTVTAGLSVSGSFIVLAALVAATPDHHPAAVPLTVGPATAPVTAPPQTIYQIIYRTAPPEPAAAAPSRAGGGEATARAGATTPTTPPAPPSGGSAPAPAATTPPSPAATAPPATTAPARRTPATTVSCASRC